MENGLPENTVPVLLQSKSGYLWIGTELGLVRFDGATFQPMDRGKRDAEIRCLLDQRTLDQRTLDQRTDASGESIWVGTSDGLVRWQDGKSAVFTTNEGLPNNSVRGLVQLTDKSLWVWTDAGLAHWSGSRFEPAPSRGLAASDITSMAAGTDGELWIGSTNGVGLLKQGHWVEEASLPGFGLSGIETHGGLGQAIVAPVPGGLLISVSEGVFLHEKGATKLALAKAALPAGGVTSLTRLSNGTIAVASKTAVVLVRETNIKDRAIERFSLTKELPGTRIDTIYADREGSLWVGTNHGLARIVASGGAATVQLLPATDPLAVNAIVSLLEDSEGDLWAGTETTGLHVLRDTRFRMVGSADGLSSDATTAVVQDSRGALWIGTRENGLNRIAPSGLSPADKQLNASNALVRNITTADGLLSNVILSLAAAPNGDLWVGTPDGLNRIAGASGKIDSFTSAEGLADDFIRSLLVEPDNSVWIGTRRGLTHWKDGGFQSLTQKDGLGSDLVGALARTQDGDLWIATLNGLSRLHAGHLTNYTTVDGLSSNVITALDVTAEGNIWIGTQGDGLNLWDGKRFSRFGDLGRVANSPKPSAVAGRGLLPDAIHAVIHDDRGHLWMASNTGLTRADIIPLRDCAGQEKCDLTAAHVLEFSTVDGLRSRETSSNSHPTACRASDGQIWFATPRGVAVVDPDHFAPLPPSPPVVIERFAVDDQPIDYDSGRNTRITAGHLRFQFDYAGLSFAAPQKLRYQYMLEGFDHGWTDAGTRKTAYYTNIPPARYRFLVRAGFTEAAFSQLSKDGNGAAVSAPGTNFEAELSFELLPHFYQTLWFYALLILLIAALIVLIFRGRVLRVKREFGAVMAERNRIAREIHDTLAQGYVGISLQLEILGELLRHNRTEAADKHLTVTQELVREGLEDARQSIWALRSQDAGESTLPVRLRRMVEQAQENKLKTILNVHGAYRSLSSNCEKEVLRIAQEAIQNVKRHAHASRLDVRLDYDERTVQLTISDDGQGFAVSKSQTTGGAKQGAFTKPAHAPVWSGGRHYGLTGMRERAALIDATIQIVSAPSQGTTIELLIPAPEVSPRGEGAISK